MVVTKTHMQGNAYEDARKVVEAIVAKRQNPRNTLIRPDRIYVSIASSYNGSRPNLDRQIMKIAEMYGVDSITALDFLHLAYDEFEAERRALGDTRQYATDEQAVLEAIAERTSGEGLNTWILFKR